VKLATPSIAKIKNSGVVPSAPKRLYGMLVMTANLKTMDIRHVRTNELEAKHHCKRFEIVRKSA
jgi:hypothetical protein